MSDESADSGNKGSMLPPPPPSVRAPVAEEAAELRKANARAVGVDTAFLDALGDEFVDAPIAPAGKYSKRGGTLIAETASERDRVLSREFFDETSPTLQLEGKGADDGPLLFQTAATGQSSGSTLDLLLGSAKPSDGHGDVPDVLAAFDAGPQQPEVLEADDDLVISVASLLETAEPSAETSETLDIAPSDVAPGIIGDAPGGDAPGGDAPSDDAPSDDAPGDDAPGDDAPSDDASSDDAPSDDAPSDDADAEEIAAVVPVAVASVARADAADGVKPPPETKRPVAAAVAIPATQSADSGSNRKLVWFAAAAALLLAVGVYTMRGDGTPDGTVMAAAAVEPSAVAPLAPAGRNVAAAAPLAGHADDAAHASAVEPEAGLQPEATTVDAPADGDSEEEIAIVDEDDAGHDEAAAGGSAAGSKGRRGKAGDTGPDRSAEELRKLAKEALVQHRYRDAYRLSGESHRKQPSQSALRMRVKAACGLKNKSAAKQAFASVQGGKSRRDLRARCRDQGVRLGI